MPEGPQRPEGPEGRPAPEAGEELPTMPPASRPGPRLRWAVREEGGPVQGPVTRQVPRVRLAPQGPRPTTAPMAQPVSGAPTGPGGPTSRLPAYPPPGRRRAARKGLVLGAAALLLGGLAAGVVIAVTASSGPRPAVQFELMLKKSASAHHLVELAVGGACKVAAPQQPSRRSALADLRTAVGLRDQVLASLARERQLAPRVPQGPQLFAELGDVSRYSVAADRDYEHWVEDLQAIGCYSAPTNDLNYQAAVQAAGLAIDATHRLEATWDLVARRLRMPVGLASQA